MIWARKVALALLSVLGVLGLVWAGCAAKSPEEEVAKLRSRYTARVNGFFVQSTPVEPMEAAVPEGEEGETEAPEPATDEALDEEAVAEPVEVVHNVHLDILIQHDSNERLPGITLDITMVDSAKAEKASWKLWVDTSGIAKATGTQISHVLEDAPYEEGDGFNVEVRPVPEAERGDYQEFASAGG